MKTLLKKKTGLLMATLVVFGVMAGTTRAFADGSAETVKQDRQGGIGEYQSHDKYTEIDMQEPIIPDAELHVYSVKDDNGSPAATTTITYKNSLGVFPQLTGVREYKAIAKEGWIFKNWTYEQFFNGKDYENYKDPAGGVSSFSETHNSNKTPYTSGNVISVNRTGTIGETVFSKRIYKVYANLNPTIKATAGEGGSITSAGTTEVSYGGNQKYDFTANKGYVIASLKIDGVEQTVKPAASGSYEFNAVKSPHTIEVSFVKAKESVPMPKLKPRLKTPAPKPQPETLAPKPQSETPAPKPEPKTPAPNSEPETLAPNSEPEKRIGMLPKTGESASYAGLIAALGFSIAGLAILRKKKMMEENNQ